MAVYGTPSADLLPVTPDDGGHGWQPPCGISPEFYTLILQPTTLCNLDCSYCYLPDRQSRRLMPARVACQVADSIAEQAARHPVEVVWHAGEPLATPIGHFQALLTAFEAQQAAGRVLHGVQTNATLINHSWCEIFREYGFRVGISIDGPAIYNRNRRDWAGRESFRQVMRGVEMLRETGVEFAAICVVTTETVNAVDQLVAFFDELGCTSVAFNIEEQEGVNQHRVPVTAVQAQQFWQRLLELRAGGFRLPVRDVDRLLTYVDQARSGEVRDLPFDPIPTVGYDGRTVILSPELLGVRDPAYDDFVIGNVLTESIPEMLARAGRFRYVAEFAQGLTACRRHCEYFDFCRGAQAGNRYFEHGTFAAAETAYCRNTRQALVQAALDHLEERR